MALTAGGRVARGVYKALYLLDGYEFLFAVKSCGDIHRQVIKLRPGVSEQMAFRRLTVLLDRIDPRPALRLVTPSPRPRQIPVEKIDELYRDANPVNAILWKRKRAALRGEQRIPL